MNVASDSGSFQPNGRHVDIKDFAPEARELLRELSPSNLLSLAIQAGRLRPELQR